MKQIMLPSGNGGFLFPGDIPDHDLEIFAQNLGGEIVPKRTDQNQTEIMAAIRNLGGQAFDLHNVGSGFPDLIVACQHTHDTFLIECKMPGADLNTIEKVFHHAWFGKIYICHDIQEAINAYKYEDSGFLDF